MNKIIERCENYKKKTLESEINKLTQEYVEAGMNFRDTGYDRYYNKMQRLEAELHELQEYSMSSEAIEKAKNEQKKMEAELAKIKKDLKNKVFYLLKAIPDCSEARSIKDYIDKL